MLELRVDKDSVRRLVSMSDDIMSVPAMESVLRHVAEAVKEEALSALSDGVAPETRTGALAASLKVARFPDGAFSVGSDAPYAWYVEFGFYDGRESDGWLSRAAHRVALEMNWNARLLEE